MSPVPSTTSRKTALRSCRGLTLSVAAIIALAGSAATVAAESLIRNGGFSALSEDWSIPDALLDVVKVADDEGHDAAGSLRFDISEALETAGIAQKLTCEANTEYVLAAWVKSRGMTPAVRVLGTVDGRESVLAEVKPASDGLWHEASARFNSGKLTEVTVLIVPHSGADAPDGTAWVDDVQVLPAAEYAAAGGRAAGGYAGPPLGENLALDKPYTLAPKPAYSYCTDEADATQLTDGEYSVGYFWVQKSTVGWSNANYADINIDLGEDSPIRGCSFNTAAGVAGVAWPAMVQILVSVDGQEWYAAGDLIGRSAKFGLPASDKYSTHRFVADDLELHGRYFRLLVASAGSYTFCDEIEVYKGSDDLLAADMGEPFAEDVTELVVSKRVAASVQQRLLKDIAALREEASAAGVSAETKAWAGTEADRLTAAAMQVSSEEFDADWRAIHPLTPTHAEIYKARARVKRELGAPELTIWHKARYDMLDPMELPAEPGGETPALSVDLMQGEFRSAAFVITNMRDDTVTLHPFIDGMPGAPRPSSIAMHQVEHIETQSGISVADALPLAEEGQPDSKAWTVTVPAGMARQVWLTVHADDLEPGAYSATVDGVSDPGIPLRIRVYPLQLPEQLTCSLGMWDYSCTKNYDMTDGNVDAAIANMQEHFVDTPWLSSGCAPWPDGFDAEGNMVGELEFERFDSWVADWADAKNYAVFLSVGSSIRNIPMTDERFPRAVGQWMDAWVAHLEEIEVGPEQLLLLLVDEPHAAEQDERIIRWARAITAAQPGVVIWEDPTYREPQAEANLEMLSVSDTICPNLGIFGNCTDAARQFYLDLRDQGKVLWFYQCSGPAKTHDPYYYHRLQHWYAFKYGATGSGFWAYADAARSGNSWNELRAGRSSYTPVYLDETSITDGKHMEAIREGLEDYEILVMLRDHAAKLEADGKAQRAARARKLLEDAIDAVCGEGYSPGDIPWIQDKDRTLADTWRVQILQELSR